MNDEKLKEIANKILKAANLQNEEKFGSVVVILMVISIILTCVRVIQECNKSKSVFSDSSSKATFYGDQIKSLSGARGWFTKMRLKKIIRRELSPEDYKIYGQRLMDAILNYGENINQEDVCTLVEAANV